MRDAEVVAGALVATTALPLSLTMKSVTYCCRTDSPSSGSCVASKPL
jgi:hypothetical protein